jgi:hypothetical protein
MTTYDTIHSDRADNRINFATWYPRLTKPAEWRPTDGAR